MLVLTRESIQEQDEVVQWYRPEGALTAAPITEGLADPFLRSLQP